MGNILHRFEYVDLNRRLFDTGLRIVLFLFIRFLLIRRSKFTKEEASVNDFDSLKHTG